MLLFPDAEPKYLIVVRPAPPPSQKKSCSGIYVDFFFKLTLKHAFSSLFYPQRPRGLGMSQEYRLEDVPCPADPRQRNLAWGVA